MCGLIVAFLNFPIFEEVNKLLNMAPWLGQLFNHEDWVESPTAKILSLITFGILAAILFWQGLQKAPKQEPSSTLPPGIDTRIQK